MFDQFMKTMQSMQALQAMQSFKIPQVDTSRLAGIQQRNVETFTGMAQAFGETTQEIMKKTAEFAQQNVEFALNASREVFTTTAPDQNLAKQGEYAKKSLTTATKQAKELAEMANKSQFKAIENFSKRFGETLDEAQQILCNAA